MASQQLLNTKSDPAVYATSNGVPYSKHPYGAQTAGPGGPLLLQDFNLMDTISHFDGERIPERVVHAKGAGAHGYFELTDSLKDISFARIFQEPGYKCPISMRFSTVGGERGSPDTLRDPRGFSIKLRTDIGNMDWVFNNTPVFFIRDPLKFPHFIHTQKRDPQTNLNQNTDSTHTWEYFVQNPESIHQVAYMFGDRGVPKSFAQMNGYSGHTFKLINEKEETTYVQFHVLADDGTANFTVDEAGELAGSAPDHNTQELFQRIEKGETPSWTLYVQTMTPEQAENFRYSINDLTKVWPHKEFPLRKFGKFVLNQNPTNYFAEIEQIAFSPSHLIPGIEPSNDPVLQSRLYSYPDTHRHRLGVNYQQLPVNKPRTFEANSGCPFLAGNFQRDGGQTFDSQGLRPNYLSRILPINSVNNDYEKAVNGIPSVTPGKYVGVVTRQLEDKETVLAKQRARSAHEEKIWAASYYTIYGFSELDVEQPAALYNNVYDKGQKQRLVDNIKAHASSITIPSLKEQVSQYWGLLNKDLGAQVAKELGVKYRHLSVDEYIQEIGIAGVAVQ